MTQCQILKNGAPHTVHVRFETSATDLNNSPSSLTCAGTPNYVGYVDHAGCDTIAGWAADRNRLNTSINVEIYDGSTLITTVLANQLRSDVGAFLGDNGLHGFNIATPASLKNGEPHTVHVRFETSATGLNNSPFGVTCSVSPQISVTPGSGQQLVTTFTVLGFGFSANGTVNRFITFPNGAMQQISPITADGSGNISWLFTPDCSSQVGTYIIWTVDVITNHQSNNITEVINHNSSCSSPAITVSPTSGQQLTTTFFVSGANFSSNGAVNRFITFPNGTTQQISSITADGNGNISWTFTPDCSSQVGTYTIWTIDVIKSQRSNNITEVINHNSSCP